MTGYLLDTNQVGRAVRSRSPVLERIAMVRKAGLRVGTCIPVLCELEVGIVQVANPATYRIGLDRLLRDIRIWPVDRATASHFADIYHELRTIGRSMSQVDLFVASLARQMRLTVVTSDSDFQSVQKLRVEDWSI